MPIYMDRHDLESASALDVAKAHREDLKIQHKYNCNGLTYWYDEERGTAFCLIEAPDADCVKRMHNDAHGLVPHQIIEVNPSVVNAFLGRIEDPKSDVMLEGSDIPVISESAYRIIMYVCLKDYIILKTRLTEKRALRLMQDFDKVIQEALIRYKGSIVKDDGKKYIISFTSAASAVMCALESIEQLGKILKSEDQVGFKFSISAGSPVEGESELFEDTILLAERICTVANRHQVIISSDVKKAYNNEILEGLPEGASAQLLSHEDEMLINKIIETTEAAWNNPTFDVGNFGKNVGLSRSQFYRKLSSISGLSPNDFIKEFRLGKALSLIEDQKGNIAQIAFESGFNSPSYFSKCFQKKYGVLPSLLLER